MIDYNKLLIEPKETLERIGKLAKLKDVSTFSSYSSEIRNPTSEPKDTDSINSELVDKANNLYQRLQSSAL